MPVVEKSLQFILVPEAGFAAEGWAIGIQIAFMISHTNTTYTLTKLLSRETTNNATGVDFSDLVGPVLEFLLNLRAFLTHPR